MLLYPIVYRWTLGLLLFSVLFTFLWALRGSRKHFRKKRDLDQETLNFLQALYAEGEIDKAEYEARKKDLTV